MKKAIFNRFTLSIFLATFLLSGCGSSKQTPTTSSSQDYQLQNDYALLHVYRKGAMTGAAISYDVYLNDEKLYRAKNKSKSTFKITKEGMYTLWAKTESKSEEPISIQFGREYYIRCGVKMGVMVGRPNLELIDNATGKSEYNKIPSK